MKTTKKQQQQQQLLRRWLSNPDKDGQSKNEGRFFQVMNEKITEGFLWKILTASHVALSCVLNWQIRVCHYNKNNNNNNNNNVAKLQRLDAKRRVQFENKVQ